MNWIIIIVIAVLIIIMLMSFEHYTFDISDTNALNNIVDQINDKQIKANNIIASKTIEGNEIGDNLKTAIMELMYPVNSFFMYNINIALVDGKPSSITNTPLDYGKWERCNYTSAGVIGIHPENGPDGETSGDKKITVNQIPPHRHNYQWNPGRSAKYNSNYEYSHTPRDALTDADIYNKDGTKITNQEPFRPYGYYLYLYRKISL